MMRPRVPSPTGTAIVSPVSVTSCPRTRPSVVSMAMVRTVASPRCWATSSTSRWPWFLVSSALRIAGRCPSNCTSTTAPMTCVIRPTVLAMENPRYSDVCRTASERFGAGNDLDQLLRDHRLAGTVVGESLLADHLAGIARGAVHRAHLRAVEGRAVFEQRAEDLNGHVPRQELGQNVRLLRFVFVDSSRSVGCALREHGRDDLLRCRDLSDDRLEAREEQRADVEGPFLVELDDLLSDLVGVFEMDLSNGAQIDRLDDVLLELPPELLETFTADTEEFHHLALVDESERPFARKPHDGGVERAAQAALSGAHEEEVHPVRARAGQEP